jgi:radical SAM superfamily enzyme YgiQ (UPF0313 family)
MEERGGMATDGAIVQSLQRLPGGKATGACKVLMIFPLFESASFWNYTATCAFMNVRYPTAPLGLITVAALLPAEWDVRLVNRNTEELESDDIAWADLVMTGGMFPQQTDTLALIDLCHRHGKPVIVGGPDATSSPHVYGAADFLVLGEAEGVIDEFLAAWIDGARSGTFTAPKFEVDVTKSPAPRFDLLKFNQYLYVGVQFSRGCPFTCEFCDIIELYGRRPRTKTPPQILAELDALYALGYRGHVDFVDDNLVGNKKALKAFLPQLAAWLEAHDYPFEFSTEASINLADDADLLLMMRRANFFALFVGIESPDTDTLVAMQKKQNTRRDMVASIHKIYAAGMFVTAGFIVGFDSETASVADAMASFIKEAAIPVCMVGLLYAVPNTGLGRRLTREGRLHVNSELAVPNCGDQCTAGLNFETLRPRRDILEDYKRILETVYDPDAYAERLERLAALIDRSGMRRDPPKGSIGRSVRALESVHHFVSTIPQTREGFWRAFRTCAKSNPAALGFVVMLMAMYLHLGPFSRQVIAAIDRRIAALDALSPPLVDDQLAAAG